jgi:hypothetical protein
MAFVTTVSVRSVDVTSEVLDCTGTAQTSRT